MSEKKTYYASNEGFINGTWRAKNEPVLLTEAQARYHLLVGNLSENKIEEPKPAKPAVKDETDGVGKAK